MEIEINFTFSAIVVDQRSDLRHKRKW